MTTLAPVTSSTVMSNAAWADYRVPASPYFVLVDGRAGVIGEGSAASFAQLRGVLERALSDRSGAIDLLDDPNRAMPMRRAGSSPATQPLRMAHGPRLRPLTGHRSDGRTVGYGCAVRVPEDGGGRDTIAAPLASMMRHGAIRRRNAALGAPTTRTALTTDRANLQRPPPGEGLRGGALGALTSRDCFISLFEYERRESATRFSSTTGRVAHRPTTSILRRYGWHFRSVGCQRLFGLAADLRALASSAVTPCPAQVPGQRALAAIEIS